MTPILLRSIRSDLRPLLGWVVGIAVLGAITAGSWPAVEGSTEDLSQVLENLPDAMTAFFGEGIADFSAAGVVGSRLFGTIGLAVFIGYAVSRGARAIAGEEADGTLELLVTAPVSRTAVAVDRVMAMFVILAVLVLLQMGILLGLMPVVGLEFSVLHVIGASVGLYLLAAMFGALAFAVGAATGSRGAAVGAGAGMAGLLFLLSGFGVLVEDLEPLADLSPFSLYDGSTALADGIDVLAVLGFAVVAVVLVAIGVLLFNRRDLS